MTEQTITKLIGKPEKINFRRPKAIGSAGFYLKSFKSKNTESENLKLDSKCNFEKRTGGILLRANYSNRLTAIPFQKEKIIEITITRGEESVNPVFLSPMWILLKFGISKLYARYFKIFISEYSIDQMELDLKSEEYEMKFIANGYLFERQLQFFENLNYQNKLRVNEKTNT